MRGSLNGRLVGGEGGGEGDMVALKVQSIAGKEGTKGGSLKSSSRSRMYG